jgi:hypothetical protein
MPVTATATVKVDPNGNISETDETNNLAALTTRFV